MILRPVHCRRCGYDLQGLEPRGQCPECGFDIGATLTHLVDPAGSRLPQLSDPIGVGTGLLGLSLTALVSVSLLALPGMLRLLDSLGAGTFDPRGVPESIALVAAALVGGTGLWWLYLVARGPAQAPANIAHRDLRRLFTGLSSCVALLLVAGGLVELDLPAPLQLLVRIVPLPSAIVTLLGLRGILQLVGLRSRAYRTARGGRQSLDSLVAAVVAGGTGLLVSAAGSALRQPWLETVGLATVMATTLLLLIGLVYLVVNCWWIRAALRRPAPALSEIVGHPQ